MFDPENEEDDYIKMMADQHVFVKGENVETEVCKLTDMKDALKLAIEFEKDSVIFFLSMQDAADGKGKELINLLVKEEQGHRVLRSRGRPLQSIVAAESEEEPWQKE